MLNLMNCPLCGCAAVQEVNAWSLTDCKCGNRECLLSRHPMPVVIWNGFDDSPSLEKTRERIRELEAKVAGLEAMLKGGSQ